MKRIFLSLLALALTLSLFACSSDFDYTPPTPTFVPFGTVEPDGTTPSSTAKTDTSTPLPTVTSLNEMRDLLNANKEIDILDVSFHYTGKETFDGQLLAQMTTSFYVYYTLSGSYCRVVMLEYVGDHVVDAYRSGDRSSLTDEENQVLDKALSIVSEARANTTNDFELEVYLHDYLAETITYTNPSTDVPDPNDPPRHLTAAGGLLDGLANCQGYADSFYTLASLAGFTVGRMSVESNSGEAHVVNTIRLDGNYYVVDVTFDDTRYGEENEVNYRLFNATEDMCDEFFWEDVMEYHPIAEVLDTNYYYFHDDDVQAYANLEAMASWIVSDWLNGKTEHRVMLYQEVSSWEALSQALESYLKDLGVAYSYRIWVMTTSNHTFYTVRFTS